MLICHARKGKALSAGSKESKREGKKWGKDIWEKQWEGNMNSGRNGSGKCTQAALNQKLGTLNWIEKPVRIFKAGVDRGKHLFHCKCFGTKLNYIALKLTLRAMPILLYTLWIFVYFTLKQGGEVGWEEIGDQSQVCSVKIQSPWKQAGRRANNSP